MNVILASFLMSLLMMFSFNLLSIFGLPNTLNLLRGNGLLLMLMAIFMFPLFMDLLRLSIPLRAHTLTLGIIFLLV